MSSGSTTSRSAAHGGSGADHASLPDRQLLELFRAGDQSVTGELFARHRDAAARVARQLVRSRADADDVVSDAFSRVFTAIDNGHGPTENFRGYLYTAVRSSACRRHREAKRLVLSSQQQNVVDFDASSDPVLDTFDRTAAGRAYGALPERWQTVLWLVDVEDRPAAEVAKILGMTPNAVAALSYRAREGLRQGFLSAHSREPIASDAACQPIRPLLSPYVRSRTAARDTLRVERHLEHCSDCNELLAELRTVNTTILHGIAPLLIPVAAIAALQAAPSWLSGPVAGGGSATAAAGTTATATAVRGVASGVVQSGSKLALPFHLPAAVVGGIGAVATAAAVTAVLLLGQAGPAPVEEALVAEGTNTSVVAPLATTEPPVGEPTTTTTPATVESSTSLPAEPADAAASATDAPAATVAASAGPTTSTTEPAPVPSPDAPPTPVGVMSVSQVGPLAPGGVGQVLIEMSQLSSGQPVRLSWTAPPGFEVRSGRSGLGGCERGGCALSPDATGTSVVSLTIAAAPEEPTSAVSPVAFAAGESDLPALEILLSDPSNHFEPVAQQLPLATSSSAFTTRFAGVGHLALAATGNSVLTCAGGADCAAAAAGAGTNGSNDLWPIVAVDRDDDPDTVNSSSAVLTLPGGARVVHAELVWGAQHKASTGMDVATMRFGIGAERVDVTADTVLRGDDDAYQSAVDVTALLSAAAADSTGPLLITGADIAVTPRTGAWGGWALAVVVEHPDLPRRATMLALGFDAGGSELSLMPGRTARLDEVLSIQWDGDPDHGPDGLEVIGGGRPPLGISDAANPLGDLANSTISIRGERPVGVAPNTFGVDVDLIQVDDGPRTDLALRTSTGPERSFAGLLGASIALD